jgi:hypothetical protein
MLAGQKAIEINRRSKPALEAEHAHLRQGADRPGAGDDFEAALEALASISRRVSVSTEAAQLIRDERDWLADRPLGTFSCVGIIR